MRRWALRHAVHPERNFLQEVDMNPSLHALAAIERDQARLDAVRPLPPHTVASLR
jgi:hypothetical protein